MLCPGSVDASLLGLSMKLLGFNAGADFEMAGNNLVGSGYQKGRVQYDPADAPPPELAISPAPTTKPGFTPESGQATGAKNVRSGGK